MIHRAERIAEQFCREKKELIPQEFDGKNSRNPKIGIGQPFSRKSSQSSRSKNGFLR
jgi:hypothetical protein